MFFSCTISFDILHNTVKKYFHKCSIIHFKSVGSPGIPPQIGLHHECFPENFEKQLDAGSKTLFRDFSFLNLPESSKAIRIILVSRSFRVTDWGGGAWGAWGGGGVRVMNTTFAWDIRSFFYDSLL